MSDNPNVLISLHKGYGLGDATQVSAVLRHLVAARPEWIIDYQAQEGQHQPGYGIVANTFAYGQPYPHDYYDFEIQICLYDTWIGFTDRPNTRVATCLHQTFNLPWRSEYRRYIVNVREESLLAARTLLWGITDHDTYSRTSWLTKGKKYVAVHYEGDTAQDKKNLTHQQADYICTEIRRLGYEPLILDWRIRCLFHVYRKLRVPQEWGADAEMVCAVIRQCEAFIGIDSGPGKCASATNIPSLIVWTGHHPAQFHDPAPNTTHLVPEHYHSLHPVYNSPDIVKWFEQNYNIRTYNQDLVKEVKKWLAQILQLNS